MQKKLGSKIIIATDTQETVWVNALTGNKIKDESGNPIFLNFDPNDPQIPSLIEKINFSIHELNDNLKPKELVNPTDLAKQIWQDIWAVSGATPENCLYTFVELFIFKYLSDLGVLGEGINFGHLVERYNYNIENPTEKALEYYANTIRPEIKRLFPPDLVDNTTVINGTIFVSKDQKAVKGYSNVFKKILFRFEEYGKLENIDYDFKSQLFESFLKESLGKKNWGQFFTPLKVVRAVCEMAKDDIKDGVSICDPACGVGKFLLEPIVTKLENSYKISGNKINPKITIHGFDKGFDKDEQKTIILAKANMLIYFSDLIRENPTLTQEFAQLFNESFTLKTNSILGTLSDPVTEKYDLILTNPPYVTSGSSNLKEEIKKDGELTNFYKVNGVGLEGLFTEWIVKALKPGGKAFVVIPDGILTRKNDNHLRQFILDECYIDAIISLPLKTFFTTIKKTYILCITKKNHKKDIQQDPVFTYLVSEIGESRDIYRFNIDQNDLQEAVALFSFFKGNKDGFKKINTDNRCKIVEIETFRNTVNKNWEIDRFWTRSEKIELGVIEEEETISFEEFPQLLEEASSTILELKNELLNIQGQGDREKTVTKKFPITDIFNIKSGNSKLTKKFVEKHKGDFVVYSANTKENGVFGYLNTFDHNIECIQITTNGVYAGTVFYREKHKFSINGDARLLIKKSHELDYQFLTKELQKEFKKHNFNWENKPTITKLKEIEISVPINGKGEYDLKTQIEIAEKYKKIDSIKSAIDDELRKIDEIEISLE